MYDVKYIFNQRTSFNSKNLSKCITIVIRYKYISYWKEKSLNEYYIILRMYLVYMNY